MDLGPTRRSAAGHADGRAVRLDDEAMLVTEPNESARSWGLSPARREAQSEDIVAADYSHRDRLPHVKPHLRAEVR